MKRSILPLVAFTFLSLLSTHPLWQRLSEAVPGDIGDPVLNTYILAWDTHALVNDPLNLFNANIFYPLPNTLAYSENLIGNALIALPIALLTGQPALATNFVFLLSFVLAGFGMHLLVLSCTHNRYAAFAAGVAFAFAPYRLASLTHLQLITLQWLPFIAYGLWQMADSKWRTHHALLFFVFLWLQIASTLHGALFAALLVFIFLIAQTFHAIRTTHYPSTPLRTGVSRFILRLRSGQAFHVSRFPLISFISFALFLLPFALPYLAVINELRAARPPETVASFLAEPSDFLAAFPWNRLFGVPTEIFRHRSGFTEEQTLFMGIVTPLLALIGVWRRGWMVGWLGGLVVGSLLLATSLLLVQAIPLTSLMRVPARWAMVMTFALAGLCGWAISGWQADKRMDTAPLSRAIHPLIRYRYPLVTLLLFVEGFSAPIPLAKIGALDAQPAVYQYLAQQPGREAIIELPMYVAPDAEFPEAKRMYASALHWRALVNGYSGFTPSRQLTLAAQMKNFPDEPSLMALRELARQGVRYLIVHAGELGIPRREWVQTNRARALQSGGLRFVQSFDDNDLFEINDLVQNLGAGPIKQD